MNSIIGSFKQLFTTDQWKIALAASFVFTALFGVIYAVISMLGIYELGNPWAWLGLCVVPMAVLAYQREVILTKQENRNFEGKNIALFCSMPMLVFILLFI